MAGTLIDKLTKAFVNCLNKERPIDEYPKCDFDRICYEIRPCDVLLVEGRSRVSDIIRMITQSAWSHAALYIGRIHDIANPILRDRVREFYNGPDDEQLIIESVLGKGTVITSIESYRNDHIRMCRPSGISGEDAHKVIGFAIGRLGRDYDMRQTFDLFRLMYPWGILPRRWRSSLFRNKTSETTREICSSLIAEAFSSVHFPILPHFKRGEDNKLKLVKRNPKLYTPRDFDYSPFFEIIKYPILEITEKALYHHLPWEDVDELPIEQESSTKVIPKIPSSASE